MYFKKTKTVVSYYFVLIAIILLGSSCNKEELVIAEQRHNLILLNKYQYSLNDTLFANIRFRNDNSEEYFRDVRFVETSPDTFCLVDPLVTVVNYDYINLSFTDDFNHYLNCWKDNISLFVNDDNRDLMFFISQGSANVENFQVDVVSDTSAHVHFEIYDEGVRGFESTEVNVQYFDSISSKYVDYGVFPTIKPQPNKYFSFITNLVANTEYRAKIVLNIEGEKIYTGAIIFFTTE
jgi:hypothetical protein